MPIKVTYTSTRPSSDVAFYIDNFDAVSYMANTYQTTGKLLATSFDDSDILTWVWTEWWADTESLEEFLADTFINQGMINRTLHRERENIKTTYVTEDVLISSVPVGVFYNK